MRGARKKTCFSYFYENAFTAWHPRDLQFCCKFSNPNQRAHTEYMSVSGAHVYNFLLVRIHQKHKWTPQTRMRAQLCVDTHMRARTRTLTRGGQRGGQVRQVRQGREAAFQRFNNSPERFSNRPQRFSNSPERSSNTPERFSNSPRGRSPGSRCWAFPQGVARATIPGGSLLRQPPGGSLLGRFPRGLPLGRSPEVGIGDPQGVAPGARPEWGRSWDPLGAAPGAILRGRPCGDPQGVDLGALPREVAFGAVPGGSPLGRSPRGRSCGDPKGVGATPRGSLLGRSPKVTLRTIIRGRPGGGPQGVVPVAIPKKRSWGDPQGRCSLGDSHGVAPEAIPSGSLLGRSPGGRSRGDPQGVDFSAIPRMLLLRRSLGGRSWGDPHGPRLGRS